MVLFPVYVGHWVLVVCRNRDQAVLVLDPVRKALHEGVTELLLRYLRVESQFHPSKALALSSWSDAYVLPNPETDHFKHSQSGLYVLKHAECYARYCSTALSPDHLRGYGRYVLERLVKRGVRQRLSAKEVV